MACTVEQFLDNARRFVGFNEFDGSYLEILKIYNSHKPLARGYAIKPGDSWCDAFVSAIAIKSNAVDIIGTEVSCELHRDIFVNKKIWRNNNTLIPKKGDIVIYAWDKYASPYNNGCSCHIGIVEKVNGRLVTAIEGNYSDAVGRREFAAGWGYVKGYASPAYTPAAETPSEAKLRGVALAVIRGEFGNGEERVKRLRAAGYDPQVIQQKVNAILQGR